MLLTTAYIIFALICLIWAADRFVLGAASVAQRFHIPPLIIGMTIVALGTSAPEIFVAGIAAFNHQPGLAIGSAIGSNIVNIGLVLGLTAFLFPFNVKPNVLWKEYPILLLCTVIVCLMFNNAYFSRTEGVVLLLLLFAYLGYSLWHSTRKRHSTVEDELLTKKISGLNAGLSILVGIVFLPISAEVLVNNASLIAQHFHISNEVIGLSVVALGTSLPELAASLVSAKRGYADIALGNVMGSNVFNIIAVLPAVGIFAPGPLDKWILSRDLPFLIGYTLIVFIFGFTPKDNHRFSRLEGAILLLSYLAYLALLFQQIKA